MPAMTDDELLERLGQCLLTDPVAPGADERAALHRALDEAPPAPAVTLHTQRPWRRIRRPVAAAIAATVLLSGSAAAAVETNTLPGPLRSLAVTLGLPVTPSAFTQAQSALSDLTLALGARDPVLVRADLARLEAALPQLRPSDRSELGPELAGVVAQAEIFLAAQPGAASGNRASATSRSGDGSGDRESSTEAGGGVHASSGGVEGTDPGETGAPGGSVPGSPAQAGPGAPGAAVPSGQSDGDDMSGGPVAAGTPSPTSTGDDGASAATSDGGSTTVGTTTPRSSSDGSGTSGGSDGSGGSGTSDGSDGGSGGSDGGGSVS